MDKLYEIFNDVLISLKDEIVGSDVKAGIISNDFYEAGFWDENIALLIKYMPDGNESPLDWWIWWHEMLQEELV